MKPLSFALIVRSRSMTETVSETVQKASEETLSSCVYTHTLNNSKETVLKIKKKNKSCREINHVWWANWCVVGNSQSVELWSNLG